MGKIRWLTDQFCHGLATLAAIETLTNRLSWGQLFRATKVAYVMIRRLISIFGLILLVGCSAIELGEQNQQATQQIEDAIAGTVESRVGNNQADLSATLDAMAVQATDDANNLSTDVANLANTATIIETQNADITATLEQFLIQAAQATDIALTTTAIVEDERTSEPDAEITPEVSSDILPTGVEITIYGSVPIDSDSLNSITALAIDDDGHLLVSLRAGEIYRLIDTDDDGDADETRLVFEDADDNIGQVAGIFVQNAVLYIVNGNQLSQLQDTDDDGMYETITQLSESLPVNQALLQANNSVTRSPDGHYFTADVNTGDILIMMLLD